MPTVPKPRPKIQGPGSSKARSGTASGESSAARSHSPSTGETRRTPKTNTLKVRLERFYQMFGTFLLPLGRFIPQARPIGENLKIYSEEAADAWIDLAEEDPKVKKYLESITGASTWGNVIGVHFVIVMGVMSQNTMQEFIPPEAINDPIQFAKDAGLSEEQIQQAVKMAEGIVSDRPVEESPAEVRTEREVKLQDIRSDIANIRAGMATPEQMNVENDGQAQWSKPMNSGGI